MLAILAGHCCVHNSYWYSWCRIIDSIHDATAFANQLKQAGFIPHPVYDIAIDGRSGQTTKDRVTNLLSSAEGAILSMKVLLKTSKELDGNKTDAM